MWLRWVGWVKKGRWGGFPGLGRGVVGNSGRTSGGEGGRIARLLSPALIEGVFRHGFGLGRIELGALVEVVRGESLGGLVMCRSAGAHAELGLGWRPGGMGQGG
jgi:hypothetical protein